MASGLCEKSVSPRVSETMIAPHSPPRVWLDSADSAALDKALAPFVDAHVAFGGSAFLTDAWRAVGLRRVCACAVVAAVARKATPAANRNVCAFMPLKKANL